jgi:hypothetical protein
VSDEADAVVSLEVELLLGDDVSDDDDGDVLEDVSLELGVVLVLP